MGPNEYANMIGEPVRESISQGQKNIPAGKWSVPFHSEISGIFTWLEDALVFCYTSSLKILKIIACTRLDLLRSLKSYSKTNKSLKQSLF